MIFDFRVYCNKCLSFTFTFAEMSAFKTDRQTEQSLSIRSSGIFLLLVARCQFVGTFKVVCYLQWHSICDNSLTGRSVTLVLYVASCKP